MSEPENFLTRWSRRKREAEEERSPEPPEQKSADVAADPEADVKAEDPQATDTPPARPEPPAVDLSTLPSIESITAETDIRAFLQPGIPLQLTRAALRRVWTADPAIRDFIGPAENAWDFTAPDGVPGFGPLQPNDLAPLTVAQATGPIAPPSPPELAEPLQNRDVGAAREAPARTVPDDLRPPEGASREQPEQAAADAAAPTEQAPDDRETNVVARHGGALPR
jgi:hypothetical protein